jgi:predicted ABC-type transport system involved in lysophospholipase L1 biosynthesis ATPase subunit
MARMTEPGGSSDSRPDSLITLRGVSRLHDGGAIAALREVDLEIAAGECMAIVGASGSGKSTLVNLLCGIDRATTGTILWEGRALRRQAEWVRLRRRGIGIVFQEFNLIPTLTALENVELALIGCGEPATNRRNRAAAALDRVGLAHRIASLIPKLSGGERQRVAIARAIVNEPRLLLADEPTGNLDSGSAALVADLLFKLRSDHGMTLVLVTHDNELAGRCERCVRIRDGAVIHDSRDPDCAETVVRSPSIEPQAPT